MGDKAKVDHKHVHEGKCSAPVECFESSSGDRVMARRVTAEGKHSFVMPDHYDPKTGKPVGHGGSIDLRKGDVIVERADGTLFGVLAADFSKDFSPSRKVNV